MSAKTKLPLAALNEKSSAGDDFLESATDPKSATHDNLLRPRTLNEYIGQKAVAAKLEVFMKAALGRGQILDHVLLSGPPGLGKTTLAHIIANEMGGRLHMAPGPTLEKSADLLSILSELKKGDVLFIDEIHRLHPAIEEALYPAMEDYQVQLIVGEGTSAQAITVQLEKFTLIGATTQAGRLTGPLRDRFGIQLNLDFYSFDEMCEILNRSKRILNIDLNDDEVQAVAQRSRGTPRIGNRLLSRVRDFVDVMRDGTAEKTLSTRAQSLLNKAAVGNKSAGSTPANAKVELVHAALEFLDVDCRGLQPLDRSLLRVLMEHFKGGPAGIEALAASLSEDRATLESLEPYLLKEGFILRTTRGRVATDKAYEHLGLEKLKSARGPLLEDPVLL